MSNLYWCLILSGFLPIVIPSTLPISGYGSEIVDVDQKDARGMKFSLFPFIVIHVKPLPCNSTKDMNGTCLSKESCLQTGGEADGTCASGFGVCCLLERRCGSIIKENNSVLVNNEYPKWTDSIGNCQYIIEKSSDDICQIRLDFDELHLAGPENVSSLCKEDTLTIFSAALDNSGVICGENSGQHMYLDLASGSGSARINIAITSKSTQRAWKIRASQISCNAQYRAPQNCLQYFTEHSGVIKSFNYQTKRGAHQIGGLSYTICLKNQEGFCGITYHAEDFSVSGNDSTHAEASVGDIKCTEDFLSIFVQDKVGTVGEDRYCGTGFNDTTTYSKPFQIKAITNEHEPATDFNNKGFYLKYMQIPC